MADTNKAVYLSEYQPSPYTIETVALSIDLGASLTQVKATLQCRRMVDDVTIPMVLDGVALRLLEISIDQQPLMSDDYRIDDTSLTLFNLPEQFVLETIVEISPSANLTLSGLYLSKGNYCTQCESEGFRRITYFVDRPDVMSVYTCTITADYDQSPVILSNGNRIDSGQLPGGRHWVTWHDPSKKPSYLFALIAGKFDAVTDTYVTQSGRSVDLAVYVESGKTGQARFALEALKKAMAWDEQTYQREYELECYMIVAVSDFNFGAMENKGLNIFNDRYVLAKTETATDADFLGVEVVVGHEYFHNWTGNRITLQNWFQLCLKEGLTVFREQGFAASLSSVGVRRIEEAKIIQMAQFIEDAGPMSHPVRPDSYLEITNFYTLTVYNKGAEVVRMLHTWLGEAVFQAGMQHYFDAYDGQAITIDEFLSSMAQASGYEMSQFRQWYTERGTPCVHFKTDYDASTGVLTCQVEQEAPAVNQAMPALLIPIRLGLMSQSGESLDAIDEAGHCASEHLLILDAPSKTFKLKGFSESPLCSPLRGFSAPVQLKYNQSRTEALSVLAHERDAYVRWSILNQLYVEHVGMCLKSSSAVVEFSDDLLNAYASILNDDDFTGQEKVECLAFPSERYLLEQFPEEDIVRLYEIRKALLQHCATALYDLFEQTYHACHTAVPYQYTVHDVSMRSLRNFSLLNLIYSGRESACILCQKQIESSDNMTDMMGAVAAIVHSDQTEYRDRILNAFYAKWSHEPLVIDKWFGAQAISSAADGLNAVKKLCQHEAFDLTNPNRVRALIGVFSMHNVIGFHQSHGAGYAFLVDKIIQIDEFNPNLAARLCQPLLHWRRFDSLRQDLMKAELVRISKIQSLSMDLKEVVGRALSSVSEAEAPVDSV
ncbi:MAG: aminopeptidase N [Legionellales bacterium]|nr:aminopeptidase N [Legionellales bacterium]